MIYEFEKDNEAGVIFITIELANKYTLKMLLDTAASRTTIDINALYMAGYSVGRASQTREVETANGIIEVSEIELESITTLGHTVHRLSVHVYDFLSHGILSDYEGVLGLDFFRNTVLTIDMKNGTVEINPEAPSNQNTALLNQNAALLNQNAALSNENAELRRLLQQSGISILQK